MRIVGFTGFGPNRSKRSTPGLLRTVRCGEDRLDDLGNVLDEMGDADDS